MLVFRRRDVRYWCSFIGQVNLPEEITSLTSLPSVVDTKPSTVNVANPPIKLVKPLITDTVIASLWVK